MSNEEDEDVRWRGDVPLDLDEEARDYIPSADSMTDAERLRYVVRQFVRDRRLEEMEAAGQPVSTQWLREDTEE